MTKIMNLDFHHLEDLQGIEPEAELTCFQISSKEDQNSTGKHKEVIKLQIKRNKLLVVASDQNIKGSFTFDYQKKFEVIRKTEIIAGERLGRATGIRFTDTQPQTETDFTIYQENTKRQILEIEGMQNGSQDILAFTEVLKKKFIVQENFHDLFKGIKKIGKGGAASVYLATDMNKGTEVAIKSFKKSVYFSADRNKGKLSFLKEFRMFTQISHPNIINFQGVYETQNSTYVVMDLIPLSLANYINKKGIPSQKISIKIIRDILEALKYLHKKQIMHRDLKPENIMIEASSLHTIKAVVIDFGLAQYTHQNSYLYVKCGTPGYIAPEILQIQSNSEVKTYNQLCDIFSLGVIVHILLFKTLVFNGASGQDILRLNRLCQIDFSHPRYATIGSGKDLLMKMLSKDPRNRITAEQALNHQFLTKI